jgi:hypothetical protein
MPPDRPQWRETALTKPASMPLVEDREDGGP